MTTATRTRQAIDTYRNPKTMAQASVRYFLAKDGRHVVETDVATECEPMYRFFAAVEDARDGWVVARGNLVRMGYTDRVRRQAW